MPFSWRDVIALTSVFVMLMAFALVVVYLMVLGGYPFALWFWHDFLGVLP